MVDRIPAMVSMAKSEQKDIPKVADTPAYPYGLCISLCSDELEKLDIDQSELCPGDILHLHCLGMVTSTSMNAQADGSSNCRVEIQITNIAAESEDEENEEEESKGKSPKLSKLYV